MSSKFLLLLKPGSPLVPARLCGKDECSPFVSAGKFRKQSQQLFTLAGFESVPKGARVLHDAMSLLEEPAAEGRVRLLVFGTLDPDLADRARRLPGVELRRRFSP